MLSYKLARLFTFGLGMSAGLVNAATVNVSANLDNSIYSENTNSNGLGPGIFVGKTANVPNPVRRGLVAFNVAASVPAGSTINSVQLKLFCTKTVAPDHPVAIHRVSAQWGEGTSLGTGQGDVATTNDATWTHRLHPGTAWTTAGGDYQAGASATQTVGGVGVTYTWGSTAAMVADVQGWLAAPASNFGWILIGNESVALTAKEFASREFGTAANRPVLTIDYTAPSSVPDWAVY